ncbi:stalk domain-containing protein [Paenibacillus alginolyticus]|uniref:stalk domain-containing protein n=1 Tax=Paenibacillus alginolyticus TaxID=59839 RepID=UPI0004219111|nr:stalk domain-containing protein [Paenibacillus alginolyticus]MCY9665739.1 stalk domain-containing protein [Paenibacillus alginolyticus]
MKNVKSIASGFILGAILFGGVSYATSEAVKLDAYFGVKLVQNGIDKTSKEDDLKPFITNGRTYVPLKAVGDLLGVDITWDGDNTAVNIGRKLDGVSLPVANGVKTVNEGYLKYAVSQDQPMMINGKSYGSKGYKVFTEHNNFHDTKALDLTFAYNLNGQYSSLTFAIGTDDDNVDKNISSTVTFTDQDGKILNSFVLSKGSIQEAVTLNIKGVTQLNMKLSREKNISINTQAIDLINPVLK